MQSDSKLFWVLLGAGPNYKGSEPKTIRSYLGQDPTLMGLAKGKKLNKRKGKKSKEDNK